MADYLRKLKMKYSRNRSRSPNPPSSIHQSGDNATITIQGSYNDVRGNQNIITNITNFGSTSLIILSKQNLIITTGHDLVRDFSWSHAMTILWYLLRSSRATISRASLGLGVPHGTLTPTKHVPLALKAHELRFWQRYIRGMKPQNFKYTRWTV